mmetsp:Transcript_17251/g.67127  ORF Transcript_17251/g.67127 Transcript_17251/m.67127 type:complete len:230 (-) Transcript_17251:26-715(-)
MPKSKRNKIVSLTVAQKGGREKKEQLVEDIRDCLEAYKYIVVFNTNNMRNTKLKDVRNKWADSRFFFGKNRVMAVALGRTVEEELLPGLSKVSAQLTGNCGLFFTNEKKKDIEEFFKTYREPDYSRSGAMAEATITLAKGPLESHFRSELPVSFPPSSITMLRTLGMRQIKLNNGVIELTDDHTICEVGDTLTPEQCKLLKLWYIKLSDFFFSMQGIYDVKKNVFTECT